MHRRQSADPAVERDPKGRKDPPDLKERKVKQAIRVLLGRKARKARPVRPVQPDLPDRLALQALKVTPVLQDRKAIPERPDHREP